MVLATMLIYVCLLGRKLMIKTQPTKELIERGYFLTNNIKKLDDEKKAINTELARRCNFEDKNSFTDIVGDIKVMIKRNFSTKYDQVKLEELNDEHRSCCKIEYKPQAKLIKKYGFQEIFESCSETKEGQAGVTYEYVIGEEE